MEKLMTPHPSALRAPIARARLRRRALGLVVASALVAGAGGAATRWSYTGSGGPEHWAQLDSDFAACAGQQQSPIDLTAATPQDLVNPQPAYLTGPARIVDNGHTVQVDVEPGSFLTVDGIPYQLLQFHFHSPSEHTVDGSSFPVELHLVHQAETGALAVIGVLITGGEANLPLVPLIADIPGKVGRQARLRLPIDPTSLLPSDRRAYRYSGSLTTPPCSEGVTWLVMATPIQASGQQIAALARTLQGNSRPPQPRSQRELVLDSTP
jgi:carbonic anhydrase